MTKIEKTSVDSGYSWVILLACTVQYMFIIGAIKSSGIIYTEMLDYFGSGAGATAWTGSLNMTVMHLIGPLVALLVELLTFRWTSFIGAIMCVVGYVLSTFVDDIYIMYLTYGVITGVGYGLIFTTSMTISSFYFSKYRAFASGIITAGSGVASFIFPFLYRVLLDTYMLHGALMMIGALFFHMLITSLLLRQPMQLVKLKEKNQFTLKDVKSLSNDNLQTGKTYSKDSACNPDNKNSNNDDGKNSDKLHKGCKIIDCSLFKNPKFVIYAFTVLLHTTSFITTVTTVLPAHMDNEFSKQKVVIAMSSVGASEFFSRLFFGWLSDRKIIKTKYILLLTLLVSGSAAVVVPFFERYEVFLAYAVTVGVFSSAYVGLLPVLLIECSGLERLPKAFGLLLFISSSGLVLGQPTAGWIADLTGSWHQSFRFVGGCSFLASLILLLEPIIVRLCNFGKPQTDDTEKEITI